MAFKYINAAISGEYQKVLSRLIADPETIDLTNTPTTNLPYEVGSDPILQTGKNADNILTGSVKSIKFDGVDDFIKLPTTEGLGTEILLEGVGAWAPPLVKHGSTANNIVLESWIKLDSRMSSLENDSEFFEVTIQRNSVSSTTGYDGNYMARTIYAVTDSPPSSAHFIDFQFASASDFAFSLTSNNNITTDEWHHIWCEYTVTGATLDPPEHMAHPWSPSWMRIYIDGTLDRETWAGRLQELAADDPARDPPQAALLPFPSIVNALSYGYDREISFDGRTDEMRLWLATGTTDSVNGSGEGTKPSDSIATLAEKGNIGIAPVDFDSQLYADEVKNDFSPSADNLVAWWRFEDLSATVLFATVPDSITDTTDYDHIGTPYNFTGSIDFSEEETIVAGAVVSGLENAAGEANTSANLFRLTGGIYDHGGMSVIHDNQSELIMEQGVDNLVTCASNYWTASTGAVANKPTQVSPDTLNIFYGSSATTVNTSKAGEGVFHAIDYSHLLFDKNDYTLSLRLLLTSGSPSAQVTFLLGDEAARVATTAIMNINKWEPVIIRNRAALTGAETHIKGEVSVLGVSNDPNPDENDKGSLFKIDGLQIHEGSYPSAFVGPQQVRKGGEISWVVGD